MFTLRLGLALTLASMIACAAAADHDPWTEPQVVAPSGATAPAIAVDDDGNALVVWHQSDGVALADVWARRFEPGLGWGAPAKLDADDASGAGYPNVAFDAAGNAFALWSQDAGVWANRFERGVGWGTATRLEDAAAINTNAPALAVDPGGNATVVWQQSGDQTGFTNWTARFEPKVGWSAATLLTDNRDASAAKLVVSPDGHVLAVWDQGDDVGGDVRTWVYSRRFEPGVGWGLTDWVGGTRDQGSLHVVIDAWGVATVAWRELGGLWTNRFEPGVGWRTPARVAAGVSLQALAIDPASNLTAVWTEDFALWTSTNWGTARMLADGFSTGNAPQPDLVVDPAGVATVVWGDDAGGDRRDLWANQRTSPGWGSAGLVETDDGDALHTAVAVDPAGSVTAVWATAGGRILAATRPPP